jgi:hypothetical protein
MDKYEKLRSLHQLMKDGAITAEEYEAEKIKLMTGTSMTLNESYASDNLKKSQDFSAASSPTISSPQSYQGAPIQNTIIYPAPAQNRRASGAAVTGFIFTLIGIIPYLSILFIPIGIILCFIGVTLNGKKYKKGLAIAGLVIGLLVLFAWALVIFFIYNHSNGRHLDIY